MKRIELVWIGTLLLAASTILGAQTQLINRQQAIDAINALPTVALPVNPQCMNGIDDDNDGRVDLLDPGCHENPQDNDETDDPPPQCTFSLSTSSVNVSNASGEGSVGVAALPAGCGPTSFTATSNAAWLVPTVSPSSVSYSYQANTGPERVGVVTIAVLPFQVTQAAVTPQERTGEGSLQVYPLEITSPRTSFHQNHKVFKAHPGVTYRHRAGVVGGSFPYRSFVLTNAPGMTVDARGLIEWQDPQGTSVTPTLTVTDFAGATASVTWTIAVSAAPFRFVDSVNGNDANDGALKTPWRTWQKVHASASGSQIVYVRAGTYTVQGIPTSAANNSTGEEYISWDGATRSAQWLVFPGDAKPTIDLEYTGNGCGNPNAPTYGCGESQPRFKINGPPLVIEGIRFFRCMTMCLQINHGSQQGTTLRGNTFDTVGPGIDGGNSAAVMFVAAQGNNSLYTVVQDNEVMNVKHGSANSGMKLYTLTKPLFEDNNFHDIDLRSEGMAIKAAIVDFTVRGNVFERVGHGIGGNQNLYPGFATRGEILFNTVLSLSQSSSALQDAASINQNGTALQIVIQRNTFSGTAYQWNTDTGDGPFRWIKNVVVNTDNVPNRVYFSGVSAPRQVIFTDNLTGAPTDGILDATGKLQGAYRKWVGLRGAER